MIDAPEALDPEPTAETHEDGNIVGLDGRIQGRRDHRTHVEVDGANSSPTTGDLEAGAEHEVLALVRAAGARKSTRRSRRRRPGWSSKS
ncbi:MAG: hypothetical protein ACKV2T_08055 [Kofleriaceae bacterium]